MKEQNQVTTEDSEKTIEPINMGFNNPDSTQYVNLPEQNSDCENSTNENQRVETRSEHDEETSRDRHLTWKVERFEDRRNTGVQILVWTNSQARSSTSRVNINDMRRSEIGTIPLPTTHPEAEGTKAPYKDIRNQFELPEYQPVVNLTRLEDFQGDITMKDQFENDPSHESPMHNRTDEQMQPLSETAAVSANEENPEPEHAKMTPVEPNNIHERHMADNLTPLPESRVSDLEHTPRPPATPETSMTDSKVKDPQVQDLSWDYTGTFSKSYGSHGRKGSDGTLHLLLWITGINSHRPGITLHGEGI
ncbi:hypothetical protein QAD02_012743 [Eretmocerus hayati]|uniref:Uncharacterized protein n=2 Tax=Eretmocerus hayati TaxID=131215 RepID=A0ACC2P0L6_9HYME|nr:hypothetical protein QAD02_008980 [Eretmocerus hayati]KAJ8676956.1 hypothetical protein QAD02_012743 [Eretmocerus hayati]